MFMKDRWYTFQFEKKKSHSSSTDSIPSPNFGYIRQTTLVEVLLPVNKEVLGVRFRWKMRLFL